MSLSDPGPGASDVSPAGGAASRLGAALSLYAFAVLGLFLLVTPWTAVWEQAALALVPEAARGWVLSGWCRGGISGLGLADLVVATQAGRDLRRRVLPGRARD
jgi:hypothetical protein